MEFIFELILQFLGEILLQAIFQLLVEVGFHSLANTAKERRHPVLSTIGFMLWGAIGGGLSLWAFPTSFIQNPVFRTMNLFVAPAAIAGIMTLVGKIRDKKGQDLVRLDRFGYAFVFAFAMAFVRFIWAARATGWDSN